MKLPPATTAVLFGLALAGSASAADLPTRKEPAPMPAIEPAYSWTGFYLGATAGYGWATAAESYSISSASLSAAPPIIPVIDAAGSQPLSLRGALLGGVAGYNWQTLGGFVLGVEGDSEWSGLSGSRFTMANIPNFPPGTPYAIAQRLQPDWQGSLRLRLGFTPTARLLVYATGGLALANYQYTSGFTDIFNETEGVAIKTIKLGGTIGAGAEYALTPNWSIKGEYRYSQFAPATAVGSALLTDGTTAFVAHSIGDLKQNAVRVGVDYHFN